MNISSVTSQAYQPTQENSRFAKMKQSFQSLGNALESGNLTDAKEALAQLQKNAPAQKANDNNPMSAKMEALSKAVDSGDLKAAQDAYADIKKTMSQRPSGRAQEGGHGGPPPGGAPPSGAGKSSDASSSSSSNKVYDVKDTNKDGQVSWEEEQAYNLKNPDETTQTSTANQVNSDQGTLNALA